MVLCVCALSDFLLSFKNWLTLKKKKIKKNWLTSLFLESDQLRQFTDFLFPLPHPRVLLTLKPHDHNGVFVNLWPESGQWLLSPQSLTQGELMNTERTVHVEPSSRGGRTQGVTIRLQNRSSSIVIKSLQSRVSGGEGVQTCCPDSFLPHCIWEMTLSVAFPSW